MVLIVSIVVIVVLALWIISLYNSLVKLRNNRENAFADIDVQLKQRHDLIPQLVATVKGYAAHEKDTLAAEKLDQRVDPAGIYRRKRRKHTDHHD